MNLTKSISVKKQTCMLYFPCRIQTVLLKLLYEFKHRQLCKVLVVHGMSWQSIQIVQEYIFNITLGN